MESGLVWTTMLCAHNENFGAICTMRCVLCNTCYARCVVQYVLGNMCHAICAVQYLCTVCYAICVMQTAMHDVMCTMSYALRVRCSGDAAELHGNGMGYYGRDAKGIT